MSETPPASSQSAGIPAEGDGLDSAVFDRWSHAYGWFYDRSEAADEATRDAENLKARQEAYLALINKTSPWPDWFVPSVSLLKPGTLFQMAMAKEQPDDRLGAFGTFDDIHTVSEVRDELAVLQSWKPTLDRVNRYRITNKLGFLTQALAVARSPNGGEFPVGTVNDTALSGAPRESADEK